MGTTWRDLRYALRSLSRRPAFALTAVATLALGIGAATAVFSVANGVILEPLPYGEPDQVVTVWASWDNFPDKTWLSIPEYQLFHQETRAFSDLALYARGSVSFTAVDNPERVEAAVVTPNTFSVLGVTPVLGRVFTWDEARDGSAGVLLSHDAWTRRYGGDPSIVSATVELDGEPTPVLGILPQGFALPEDLAGTSRSQVFFPYDVDIESPSPGVGTGGSHGSFGLGRLREGFTVEDARADLEGIMSRVEPIGLYAPARRFAPRAYSAQEDVLGSARTTVFVLLGAVGFLLLIACGNVANLLLSRADARAGEAAIRTALGAGRGRIVRELLTESAVLALLAGALGLGLAYVGIHTLLSIDPSAVPRSGSVRLDPTVAAFALAASLVTAILCGLVPALRVARAGVSHHLRRETGSGRIVGRLQGLLVASQMAMAIILLTASGLMMRSFVGLAGIDPGFHPDHLLTARITAAESRYPDAPSVAAFYERALDDIEQVPGVRTAAAARILPLASSMGDAFFRPVGYQPAPNESTQADWQWATPGYVEAMGIPLVEGRTFTEDDRRDGQAVVVLNEAMARRYWGDESPVGSRVAAFGALDTAVVVGVVGDVRHNGLTSEVNERYYVPHAQVHASAIGTMRSMTLTIATEGDPAAWVEPVRARLRSIDPSMPVSEVQSADEIVSGSLAQQRFALVLLATFATLALVLALVGTYGVLAHLVGQRTREIGLRMALGAAPGMLVAMVVRQGLLMALLGIAAGTAVAWTISGVMSSLLYEVAPQDPVTFAIVPLILVVVALVASWLPAVRATRVHPSAALRYD